MKWFQNKKKIVDERIVSTQNKIYREISILVFMISILSIIVKLYLYGPQLTNVITEYLILITQGVYYLIRSSNLGIYSDEVELKERTSNIAMSTKNILIGLGLGIAIGIYFGARSAYLYGESFYNSVWYFFLVFFASFLIYVPFFVVFLVMTHHLANRRSKKVNEDTYHGE